MNSITMRYTLAFLSLYLCTLPVTLQKPSLHPRDLENKFSQVWKTSEATRKKYSWKTKTEVIRAGKVMQVLIEEFSFGSDGRQIRKTISNLETPLPSTFIIRQLAEDQKEKIVGFMSELRPFLEKYALNDDDTRHAFFSKANMGVPDGNGQFLVSGSDVFVKGDALKWWIDTKFYTITRATISTTFKGTKAEFSATYYLLPGMNYMVNAVIRIPSKDMVIKLQFYDFIKQS